MSEDIDEILLDHSSANDQYVHRRDRLADVRNQYVAVTGYYRRKEIKYDVTVTNSFGAGNVNIDGSQSPSGVPVECSIWQNHTLVGENQNHQAYGESNYLRIFQLWQQFQVPDDWTNPKTIQVREDIDVSAIYRKQFNLSLQSASYVESGSGGTYKVDSTNVGSSWSGTMLEVDNKTLEAVPPSQWILWKWNSGSTANPVHPTDHFAGSAYYKAHLASSHSSVLTNNGQHRMVQLSNASEFVITYVSMGELWATVKSGGGSFSNEVRVSSGTGGNELPCLTNIGYASDNKQFVVWRRNNGGGSYSILFSSRILGSWRSSPVSIASVSGVSPIPLVTVKSNNYESDLYVVYESSAGSFQTWHSTNDGESWSDCGSTVGAPSSLSLLEFLEHATTTMTVGYGAADGTIALRDFTSAWGSPVTVEGSGPIGYWEAGGYELSLSDAHDPRVLRYSNRTFIAWNQVEEYLTEGWPYVATVSHKVYQERDQYGNWSTATAFLAFDDVQWQQDASPPRLSVLSGENIALEWPYFGELIRAVRIGGEWSATSVGEGSDPELSVSGGVKASSIIEAHPVATSGLYKIETSSSFSSRVTPDATTPEVLPLEYSRLVSIRDTSTGACYSVHVTQPRIGSIRLPFVPVNDTLPNITEGNFWSFLNTIPVTATNSSDTITFDIITRTKGWGKSTENLGLNISLVEGLSGGAMETKLSGESKKISIRIPVGSLEGSDIGVQLTGGLPERESALVCQLTHVYRIAKKEAPIELFKTVKKPGAEDSPKEFGLGQNYPNPFNPSTSISFTLGHESQIRMVVFDLLGREIAILAEGQSSAGTHSVTWDAEGLPTGTYVCRLHASDNSGTTSTRSIRMQYVR